MESIKCALITRTTYRKLTYSIDYCQNKFTNQSKY